MPVERFSPRAGVTIAYHKTAAAQAGLPGVLFMGGFMSDMTGTKATYLEAQCQQRGQAYVRFDYTGHGASSGAFTEGNIGSWLQDALDVLDNLTQGPQIIVASSMGGWLALLLALRRRERVAALVCLAAAPDFSEEIYNKEFTDAQRAALRDDGIVYRPSGYGDPYPLTRQLFENSKNFLLLHDKIDITCPVRLIHGKQDPDVPWQKSEKIKQQLTSADVKIIWVEDGDHRLSREEDLRLIDSTVAALTAALSRP